VNAFAALFNPEAARGLTETYMIRVDGDTFTVRLEDGHMGAQVGAAADANLDASMDMETFFGLSSGELKPRHALATGRVEIEGEPETLERCFKVLSFTPRTQALGPVPTG
jgi:putative sterol carrier protein